MSYAETSQIQSISAPIQPLRPNCLFRPCKSLSMEPSSLARRLAAPKPREGGSLSEAGSSLAAPPPPTFGVGCWVPRCGIRRSIFFGIFSTLLAPDRQKTGDGRWEMDRRAPDNSNSIINTWQELTKPNCPLHFARLHDYMGISPKSEKTFPQDGGTVNPLNLLTTCRNKTPAVILVPDTPPLRISGKVLNWAALFSCFQN